MIVGTLAFNENIYNGDKLKLQLSQTERLTGKKPRFVIVDSRTEVERLSMA